MTDEQLKTMTKDEANKTLSYEDKVRWAELQNSKANLYCKRYTILDCDEKHCFETAREAFAALIDKISGKGTWKSNPFCFCYTFKLID